MAHDAQRDFQYWHDWHERWTCRIRRLAGPPPRADQGRRRTVTTYDVLRSWLLLELPALEVEYRPEDWWLALSPAERRAHGPAPMVAAPVRAPLASGSKPGYSLDAVGPFLKLPDGTVLRERATAARRLWRDRADNVQLNEVVDWLWKSRGKNGRPVRGRSAQRVLDALAARSLVELGLSQLAAARSVSEWLDEGYRDADREAQTNRRIWRELRIPAVAVSGGP